MNKEPQRIGEIMPVSVLAGIDGGEMFEKVRSVFSGKHCPLISKNGINFDLLLVSAKLIKSGEEIGQEAICANCKFRISC